MMETTHLVWVAVSMNAADAGNSCRYLVANMEVIVTIVIVTWVKHNMNKKNLFREHVSSNLGGVTGCLLGGSW